MYTEIRSETHHSVNTDDNNNTLAMKTHDLQSDESHAQRLPRLQPSAASIHSKIRPTSKVSVVSLEARQWSLRSTLSPSLPTAAMMDGQMRTWLTWRKNWGWL
jgi:hypothetical protein